MKKILFFCDDCGKETPQEKSLFIECSSCEELGRTSHEMCEALCFCENCRGKHENDKFSCKD